MKTIIRVTAAAAATALVLSACSSDGDDGAGSGESVTLSMATMVQPNTPNAPVQNWFLDQLEERSDGRITIDRTEPETICKASEIAECVRDGRADIGISISDYTPQLFPTMSVATIPFMAENSQALMAALYQANTENEAAAALWDQAGIEYIAAWGPGKLVLGSSEPLDNMQDLEGVRMRVTGFYLQQAFDQIGSNVVAIPAAETYEGVEKGLADAVAWTLDGAVDYKLMEQLGIWTDPGVGHYTTFAIWLNKSVYDALPDDLKAIVDEVRDELNGGAGMEAFKTQTDTQCETLLDFAGFESISAWDPADTEEWKDAVQSDLIEQWKEQAATDGLTDAEGFLSDYQTALEEASGTADPTEDPVGACIAAFDAE